MAENLAINTIYDRSFCKADLLNPTVEHLEGNRYKVASTSERGKFYEVELPQELTAVGATCTCPAGLSVNPVTGQSDKECCVHRAAAHKERVRAEKEREKAQRCKGQDCNNPATLSGLCQECQEDYNKWASNVYGYDDWEAGGKYRN